LVLRRASEQVLSDPASGSGCQYRVVSAKMEEKGRAKLFGCGPSGRHLIVRLDRHRSADNAAWDQLSRGDVIELEGTTRRGEDLGVGRTTRVRTLRPAVRCPAPRAPSPRARRPP